jgi:hypothetical protein
LVLIGCAGASLEKQLDYMNYMEGMASNLPRVMYVHGAGQEIINFDANDGLVMEGGLGGLGLGSHPISVRVSLRVVGTRGFSTSLDV